MLGKAIGLRNEAYLENELGALFEAGVLGMQVSGRVRAGCGGCRSCFPEPRSNGCRVSGDGRRSVRITGLYRGMEFPCGGWCRVRCEEHDGEEVVKEAELLGGRHSEATRVSARRCFRLVFDTCDSHGFF